MGAPSIIIAVDGCSSTGKSSFARMAAARFGMTYMDSGALYRGVTLFALEQGFIKDGKMDEKALRAAVPFLKLSFVKMPDGTSHTFMGNKDIEGRIRTMEVAAWVSPVATLPFVREHVDSILHGYGQEKGIIMDGRDIGTGVFPDAELKIFMTASLEVRAARRMEEMRRAGKQVSLEEVKANLEERDYIDSHREMSPLAKAEDALVLDNSTMTLEEELDWLAGILKERFGYEA